MSTCTACGGAFRARTGATSCSPACRQKAYRQRVRNELPVTDEPQPYGEVAAMVARLRAHTRRLDGAATLGAGVRLGCSDAADIAAALRQAADILAGVS